MGTEIKCDRCGKVFVQWGEDFNRLCKDCFQHVEASTECKIDGYEFLRAEFAAAAEQASGGKGKERHANDLPFEDQPILAITRLLEGHPCGALAFQVIKKTIEAGRLVKLRGNDAAVAEIYGAMNYAAAMAIRLKELGEKEAKEFKHG